MYRDNKDDDVVENGDKTGQSAVNVHDLDAEEAIPRATAKSPDYRDVGYSWVILCAVTFNYFLVAMGLGALGVLYPHFVDHFRCSQYEAGWIGSLHMAVGARIGQYHVP
jgi:hypothetical protein